MIYSLFCLTVFLSTYILILHDKSTIIHIDIIIIVNYLLPSFFPYILSIFLPSFLTSFPPFFLFSFFDLFPSFPPSLLPSVCPIFLPHYLPSSRPSLLPWHPFRLSVRPFFRYINLIFYLSIGPISTFNSCSYLHSYPNSSSHSYSYPHSSHQGMIILTV